MNGQEIVTMCSNIIKRQDLNTDLLLQFINQQRRYILRSAYLYRIQKWEKNLEPEDGFVRTARLKQARYVEWQPDPFEEYPFVASTEGTISPSSPKKKKLLPLNTMQDVYRLYNNVDVIGEPRYYVVVQGGLQIVPMPTIGVINVYGEWYPEDLSNSEDSEDGLSKEIGDIIVYAACAEYFDFLMEPEKAQMWRQKAEAMLEQYLKEIKRQMTDDRPLFERDPFGNLPMWNKIRGKVYLDEELNGGTVDDRDSVELTGGTQGDIYNNVGG